ncbi:MAG: efflux RND transporter periplasmic adaptor subunit [Verrucomicrobia bacterium]|nr:efflux RND transporter periplasmic adaptor subunit [Verrucomicrobiota bacterium]
MSIRNAHKVSCVISFTRLFSSIFLLLTIGFVLIGCDRQKTVMPPVPPPVVTIAKPVEKEVVEWDEYTGRTDAVESVDVRPRVSGYIDNITFKAGDVVDKDDLLFVIDPRPYQAILDQAQAQLRQADAQRGLQEANFERSDRLRQTGVISKEEYDNSVSQKNVAEAQYVAAQAAVNSAQLNVTFTELTSPIKGRIGRELVTIGNLVQADNTLLTNIVSIDPIYAYFNVDERSIWKYVRQVKEGQRPDAREAKTSAYLQVENEDGFPHEGVIDFINNSFNSSTGTLEVRARFPNADGFLVPGAFVRVRLAGGPKFQATLVTDRAIGTDQGQKFVLVVDANNVVQSKPVELGSVADGLRIVRKGLQGDENVIINGIVNARPGLKVNPKTGDMSQYTVNQLSVETHVHAGRSQETDNLSGNSQRRSAHASQKTH